MFVCCLINYGGYPEVVFSDKIREDPGQFIRHDIIYKVLLRDLPSIYGISDVQELETAVYAQWIPRTGTNISYANWKNGRKDQGEDDIVGINPAKLKPEWAVEIKWTDAFFHNPQNLLSLKTYMEKNEMDYAMVTTKTETGMKDMPFGKLQFIPVACYAYTVGRNTLSLMKNSFGI